MSEKHLWFLSDQPYVQGQEDGATVTCPSWKTAPGESPFDPEVFWRVIRKMQAIWSNPKLTYYWVHFQTGDDLETRRRWNLCTGLISDGPPRRPSQESA